MTLLVNMNNNNNFINHTQETVIIFLNNNNNNNNQYNENADRGYSFEFCFKYLIIWSCLLLGIPGNLFSIVLCYRSLAKYRLFTCSLFHKYFRKKRNNFNSKNSSRRSQLTNTSLYVCGNKQQQQQPQYNNNNNNDPDEYLNKAKQRASYMDIKSITKHQPITNGAVGNARKSFELYLIQISIFDLFMLIYWLSDEFVEYLYNKSLINIDSLVNISNTLCKFFIYMNRVNGLMCMWLTLSITCIRCIVISTPLPTKFTIKLNTMKSNIYCFNFLFLFFILINLYVFDQFELKLIYIITASSNNGTNSSMNLNGYEQFTNHTTTFQSQFNYIDGNTQSNRLTYSNTYVYMNHTRYQCLPSSNSSLTRNLNNFGIGIVGYCLPSVLILVMNIFIIYKVISSWYKLNNTTQKSYSTIKTVLNTPVTPLDANVELHSVKNLTTITSSSINCNCSHCRFGSFKSCLNRKHSKSETSKSTTKSSKDETSDSNEVKIIRNNKMKTKHMSIDFNNNQSKLKRFTNSISSSYRSNRSSIDTIRRAKTKTKYFKFQFCIYKKNNLKMPAANSPRHMSFIKPAQNNSIKTSNEQIQALNSEPIRSTNAYNRRKNNTNIFNHLVAVSLSYIICYIPYSLAYILGEIDSLKSVANKMNYYGYYMRYISHSISFYAYIISGRRFRNDFIKMITSFTSRLRCLFSLPIKCYCKIPTTKKNTV